MKLSDTALIILNAAAQRADRLVEHRKAAAPGPELTSCRSMVSKGLLALVAYHSGDGEGLVTTPGEDGEAMAFWITDDGLRAVNIEPTVALPPPGTKAKRAKAAKVETPPESTPEPEAAPEPESTPPANDERPSPRASLRAAALEVLAAWEGGTDTDPHTLVVAMEGPMNTLRILLASPERKASGPRAAGGMTDIQTGFLELCSRPEGATAKELAQRAGWPSIAARTTLAKMAERYGLELDEKPRTGDRGITFYLSKRAA